MRHGTTLTLMSFIALALVPAGCREREPAGSDPKPVVSAAPTEAARARPAATEILFGEVGSFTGQEATFGISTHNGILLAVDALNAAGGIDGKKIRILQYDDQGKPTEAAAATTKLIVQDRVHLILGEVASSRSLAMAPIAEANQVPMVSPSSTNPRVTEGKQYVFRVCFIDPFQGTVMAKFARETLGLTKVAVLRDVRNDYSVGLADYFVQKFVQLGGSITSDQSYSAGDIDFKSQLTSIRGTSPEAIFIPGYYTDVGLIARQTRELGIELPLLGGDGWDSAKLYEIGGDALEGSFFSNHYSPDDPSPTIQEFVKAYSARFGETPDSLAAQGYDAAMIAADAIRRAGSLEGPAIKDALAATTDYPGVTGRITINAEHNAVKPAVVLEVRGGRAVFKATIPPES